MPRPLSGVSRWLLIAVCSLAGLRADVTPAALFGDGAVLQRDKPVPIWGRADPGERVVVSFAGREKSTTADSAGRWSVTLDALPASSTPATLTLTGKNTVTIRNVLVGEVWLASGQSNMERKLRHIRADDDIAASADDALRFFNVNPVAENGAGPADNVRGRWQASSPENSPAFSAVAWYFARRLREQLGVPVGVLSASVGGTPVEAWTSLDALLADKTLAPQVEADLRQYREFSATQTAWVRAVTEWTRRHGRSYSTTTAETVAAFATAPADASAGWKTIRLPGEIPVDGVVWVRREVTVPPSSAGKELLVDINEIVGVDTVYWNGRKVGGRALETYGGEGGGRRDVRRQYRVPAETVTAGTHTLAVRLYAPWARPALRGGYFTAGTQNLGGEWLFKAETTFPPLDAEALASRPAPLRAPLRPWNLPASLYDNRIAPLVPYALRGAIWYQGEHNTDNPARYRVSFPALINDWRARWNDPEMPFYWCQLPNFQDKTNDPDKRSGWPGLRAAQTHALSLPHTGQAVLIDVGEAGDIHPANKRDPGRRLAAIALAKTYGRTIEYSGPVCTGATAEDSAVSLRFDHLGGGLVAHPIPDDYLHTTLPKRVTKPLVRNSPGSELEGFALRDQNGGWFWAEAHIQGDRVVVRSRNVSKPTAVRYAWSANPTCNLYNKAGLPAAPFEIEL